MKISKILFIVCVALIVINVVPFEVLADVGNFNSYGGSSGGGGFSSSWGSGGSGSSSLFGISYLFMNNPAVTIIVIILIVVYGIYKTKNSTNTRVQMDTSYKQPLINKNIKADEFFAEQGDTQFSSEKFCSYAEYVFIRMQDAWSERDWKLIRPYESDSLFEKHNRQLEWYIKNKQINKMDRVCVNNSYIMDYYQTDSDDVIQVFIDAKFNDYIIDEVSGKVIKGNPDKIVYMNYKMIFVRTKGIKTGELIGEKNTLTCPNCKANIDIVANGKCEYCDTIIISKENQWVLNDLDNV